LNHEILFGNATNSYCILVFSSGTAFQSCSNLCLYCVRHYPLYVCIWGNGANNIGFSFIFCIMLACN